MARADEWIVSCEWMLFNSLSFARYARTRFNNNKPTHYKHTARTNTHLCARTHLSTAIEKIKQVHLCKHWWSRPDVCRLNASCHLRAQERVLPSLCVFSPQKDTYTLLFSTHMCVWRKPNRRIDKRRPVSLDYIQFSSVWTSYSKQIINACKRLRFSGNMFSFLTNPVTSITRNRHTAANQIAASHICVTHLGQPTQRHFSVSM